MQGKGPGDRPRAMGIFTGKGSSEHGRRRCSERGQLYTRAPLLGMSEICLTV